MSEQDDIPQSDEQQADAFDIEAALGDVEEPIQFDSSDGEDVVSDSDDFKDRLDEHDAQIHELTQRLEDAELVLPDVFDPVFPARLTAFTSGTAGVWQEQFSSGTVMVDFSGGRFTSAASNTGAMYGLPETGFLSVEQITPDSARFPSLFGGAIDVYLTNNTTGTFDGYIDAAKTIKVFAGQTIPSARGLARLVGKTFRFLGQVGQSGFFPVLVKHNGSDGAGPTYDVYALADTGYVTKLNLAGPLSPENSRARWNSGLTITAAPDGTTGEAYYATSGAIVLYNCKETDCLNTGINGGGP